MPDKSPLGQYWGVNMIQRTTHLHDNVHFLSDWITQFVDQAYDIVVFERIKDGTAHQLVTGFGLTLPLAAASYPCQACASSQALSWQIPVESAYYSGLSCDLPCHPLCVASCG